ncbi:MAG: hypothetical protein IPL65_09335 [Lewinellaceae bacterium]|nr:hypothetical protein [Lewinellaceae bacterium]
MYTNGHGHMLIKMNALLPVADTKTPETDQGSMIRFLGELCWFPAAAVSDYLQWEQTDSLSARATIRYAGLTGTGNFHFSPTGGCCALMPRGITIAKAAPPWRPGKCAIPPGKHSRRTGTRRK